MHPWFLAFFLIVFGATANAYHSGISETTTADARASCNAAFHSGCVDDGDHEEQTQTASSSGFAAPAGGLGSSPAEIVFIALLVGGIVVGRRRFSLSGPGACANAGKR